MNNYELIASEIVKYQVEIIGSSFVIELAEKVNGLKITSPKTLTVSISGEPKKVINELVSKCEFLWGKLGTMECKEVSKKLLSLFKEDQIPDKLK